MKKKDYPYIVGYILACVLVTCLAVCVAAGPISLTLRFLGFLFGV